MNGSDSTWKWIAGTLASVMLMGAAIMIPAYVALLRAPSQVEVTEIRDRQEALIERIATLEERLNSSAADRMQIHTELQAIDAKLDSLLQKH